MPFRDVVVGGLRRIQQGVFGIGDPHDNLSSPHAVIGDTKKEGGHYAFHEGDLFTPGTGNWVFEPAYETPLSTIWGMGFLRVPNTFNPIQPQIVYTQPKVVVNGIGGQIAGQMALQPLLVDAPEQGG